MNQDHLTPAILHDHQQLSTNNTVSPSAYASPVPGRVPAFPKGKAEAFKGTPHGAILSQKKEFQSPFSRITDQDWKDFRLKILSPAQPSDTGSPMPFSRESNNCDKLMKFNENISEKGKSQVKRPSQFCPVLAVKGPPVISSFLSMPVSPVQKDEVQQPILNFDTSKERQSLNAIGAPKNGKRFERRVSNFLDEDPQPPINVIGASQNSDVPARDTLKQAEPSKTILKNRSPFKKEAKVSHFKAVAFEDKVKDIALGVAGTHLKPPVAPSKANRKKLNSLKTTALANSKPLLTPPSKKNDRASVPDAPHKINPEVDDFLFEIPSLQF